MQFGEALAAIECLAQEVFNRLRGTVPDDELDKLVESRILGPYNRLLDKQVDSALGKGNVGQIWVSHLHDRVKIVIRKRGCASDQSASRIH